MKIHFSILFVFLFVFGNSQTKQQPDTFVKDNFIKKEMYIPMRDGVKLFTSVYIPKDISNKNKYPFLMQRTCYSVAPYGENEYKTKLGPNQYLMKDKYIFVFQDVRGRYMSEGMFTNMTPQVERKTKKEIKNIVKVKYNNNIYYDAGRGSNYDGYKFYTDKSLSQEIMKFDIITQFGVALHSSLGDNPYNRELTEKEKEYREKNRNHFEELKGLYKKAVQNPNVEQKISY